MKITIHKYQDLIPNKLYEILMLRSEVFVVEQNCAYQDLDNKDQKALHNAIAYCDAKLADIDHERAALSTARQAYVNDLGNSLKED